MARPDALALILCLFAASLFLESKADSICESNKKYNTFYPGDCNKYYSCVDGKATAQSCGWFYNFDETSGECRFHIWIFPSINCRAAFKPTSGPPSTTPTSGSPTTDKMQTSTTKSTGGSSGSAAPSTSPTKSSSQPNGPTTHKPNGASSLQYSILLTTLCSLCLSVRLFH